MSQTLFADNWFRIAGLKPRLRPHAQIHRQRHRGAIWYVLQDRQSGRFFRVSPGANHMLCLMDGRRSIQRIWDIAGEKFGPERPTQDDVVRLLVHLHHADLLAGASAPDMAELEHRASTQRRHRIVASVRNPLAMRLPLLDPNRFLDATLPIVRPLFSRVGFLIWVVLLATGVVLAALHWPELSTGVVDRALAANNVVLLFLTYPIVKALHELGHAYATKQGGGEVHEMGMMLLVFLPVPYVDASASSTFRSRWQRALVGSAGIMVELALASVAIMAWTQVSSGLVRASLFNVMLIASASTLLVNGNPLLRFDGYYVLSDLIEIPNLDTRSKRHLIYLIQRHLLGFREDESPMTSAGERRWGVAYGVASFLYRLAAMSTVALLVASRFFGLGLLVAAGSAVQLFLIPLIGALRFVVFSPRLRRRRRRAWLVIGGAMASAAVALFAVPLPYATVVEGVVWVPEDDILRAGGDGFVSAIGVPPGADAAAGQPVMELRDPIAAAQVDVKRAQLAALQSRFNAVNLIDLVQADLTREELGRGAADLARAEQRQRDLTVHTHGAGRVAIPDASKLIGKFVHDGDLLGYAIGPSDVTVRAIIPEEEIDLVRTSTRSVAVRLTEAVDRPVAASVIHETPAALDRSVAPALTQEGGGPMVVDPSNPKQQRPLQTFYAVDLKLDGVPVERIGGRAYVRFDHGSEPIGWRILRAARQLFLRAVHV